MQGVSKNTTFILSQDAPVLNITSGKIEDTGIVLLKGTVVDGVIKTKIVGIDGEKVPVKLLSLSSEKNSYIVPSFLNVYTKEIEEIKGLKARDTPVKKSAFGEKTSSIEGGKKASAFNRFTLNIGVPALTAYIGYRVAKKQGGGTKKILIYTIGFGLLGFIPKYMSKS
jgi:hypothetical protein